MARAPHLAPPVSALMGFQSLGHSKEREMGRKTEDRTRAEIKGLCDICKEKMGIIEVRLNFNKMNPYSLL